MNFLLDSYRKSLVENEKNQKFWENYLDNLKSLDLSVFADKLKVPILVPIGSRILFRGELIHTNEITVALGADYFAKCSVKQAEVLREYRIQDAESKLEAFLKERKYLENRLSFGIEQISEKQECEISEFYSEEELRVWKEKHRQHVREYKQKRKVEPDRVIDDELWNRLEELELQEELENELQDTTHNIIRSKGQNQDDLSGRKDNCVMENMSKDNDGNKILIEKANNSHNRIDENHSKKKMENRVEIMETLRAPVQTPKLDLLQQVLEKQYELEDKLLELKTRERSETKTESDLLSRLDEIEELDDLEDEMNRLDDVLQSEDVISEDEDEISSNSSVTKKSVTFADDEDNETVEVTFKHSNVLPCEEPYNADKGILKPSDVYEAFPKQFKNETSSILKKSKYEPNDKNEINVSISTEVKKPPLPLPEDGPKTKRVTLNDVVEKTSKVSDEIEIKETRPMSLYKQKRLQRNS